MLIPSKFFFYCPEHKPETDDQPGSEDYRGPFATMSEAEESFASHNRRFHNATVGSNIDRTS